MTVRGCLPVLLLPLAAALVAGAPLVPPAHADYPPPPLQQVRDGGVSPEDVQCNAGLVHAVRANGAHVCVREATAERLGWEIFAAEKADSAGAGGPGTIPGASPPAGSVDDGRGAGVTAPPRPPEDQRLVAAPLVTVQSKPLVLPDTSMGGISELSNNPPRCILPSSVSVSVPGEVLVRTSFDVVITPSFDLTEQQLDKYNQLYGNNHTRYDSAEDIWERACTHNRSYSIIAPANYVPSWKGGSEIDLSHFYLIGDYYPPYNAYVYTFGEIDFDAEPTSIRMTINEPTVYTMSDLNDLSNFDYYEYDFGWFSVTPNTASGRGVPTYAAHNSGMITFSKYEPISGQDSTPLEHRHPGDQFIPYKSEHYFTQVWHFNPAGDPRAISHDVPFEWIVEELENGPYRGSDPEQFIRQLGLDGDYVEDFFEAHPEYRRQVSGQADPGIAGQGNQPNVAFVAGYVVIRESNISSIPVDGVKACAFDVSGDSKDPNPTLLKNGAVDACDITDSNGYFRILVPLTGEHQSPGTPDITIRAYYESDDFKIMRYGFDHKTNSPIHGSRSVWYTEDTSAPRRDISGPIFNYGLFYLKPSDPSTNSNYILDTLQPVHDWYGDTVGYDPAQSVIYWMPEHCLTVGVDSSSNVMELNHARDISLEPCPNTVISPLRNPHTLRHEYAHQVQNQAYKSMGHKVGDIGCGLGHSSKIHSPIHPSGYKCAWIEGWAFFMAVAYDFNPVYQPNYMRGQWNFETRANTETQDDRFANRSFPLGKQEGNVAAALYDVVDATNEANDNLQRPISDIWDVFNDRSQPAVETIDDFKENWDRQGKPSLDDIFELNTITYTPSNTVTSFSDDFQGSLSQWTLSGDSDWEIGDPEERIPYVMTRNNKALVSSDCDLECTATISATFNTQIPLRVTYDWFVDREIDSTNGMYFQYSLDDIDWVRYNVHSGRDADTWSNESFLFYLPVDFVKFRFVAESSESDEHTEIDNVVISSTDGVAPVFTTVSDVRVRTSGTSAVVSFDLPIATDNADSSVDVTCIPAPGSSFRVGTTQVTCTATDNSGNQATIKFNVIVTMNNGDVNPDPTPDRTPPRITAPSDITAEATGPRTTVSIGTAIVTDDTDPSPAVTNDAPSSFRVGRTTVTWTATDMAGNNSTDTQTVTIRDTMPPAITAPPVKTAEATGTLTKVGLGRPAVSDTVDASPTVTNNAPAAFRLGTTTVTWTATDDSGNSATAAQRVTVRDTTPPSVTAPPSVTREATAPLTTVSLGSPAVSDIVDGSPVVTSDAPAAFPVGRTAVTWTATDSSGNAASAVQTVTIRDTTPPAIAAPSNVTAEATGVLSAVNLGSPSVSDVADVSPTVTSDAPAAFPVGSTTVTWTATDSSGNAASAVQTVTIRDTTPPAIAAPPDVTAEATGTLTSVDLGTPAVSDIADVSPTVTSDAPAAFPLGDATVTWTATDSSGNSASDTQAVTVRDTTPPSVVITGGASVSVPVYSVYSDAGATCTDAVDGDVAPAAAGSVNASALGPYEITYTCRDTAGNVGSAVRTVTVYLEYPQISIRNGAYVALSDNSTHGISCGISANATIGPVFGEPHGRDSHEGAADFVINWGDIEDAMADKRSWFTVGLVCHDAAGNEHRMSAPFYPQSGTDRAAYLWTAASIVTSSKTLAPPPSEPDPPPPPPPPARPAIFSDIFAASVGSWAYMEVPHRPSIAKTCHAENAGAYSLSHSAERGGSAHVRHSEKATCWFGLAGAVRNFTIPAAYAGHEIRMELYYRTLSSIGLHFTNMYVTVSDSGQNVIWHETLYEGKRNTPLRDTGWQQKSFAINASPGSCPCQVFVYVRDAWFEEWRNQAYFDGFNLTAAPAVAGAAQAGRPALPADVLFEAVSSDGTLVLSNVLAHPNEILVAWEPLGGPGYGVLLYPQGRMHEAVTDVTAHPVYRFAGLEPDTEYVIKVRAGGDRSTDAAVTVRTPPG